MEKKKKVVCPKCLKSEFLYVKSTGERVGKTFGAGLGFAVGSCSTEAGIIFGGSIGSVFPGVGTLIGMGVGGVGFALTGLFTGHYIGKNVGERVDKEIISEFRCGHCDTTFKR